MNEIASLVSEYGVVIVTASLFIAAAVLIFWQSQNEKKDLQRRVDEHTEKIQSRLDQLEDFQRVELVSMNHRLTKALEQTQTCLKDSTEAMNKITEILIVERAKRL